MEVSKEEFLTRIGSRLFEVPSESNDGVFDLVVTNTEFENVSVKPHNPHLALLDLANRRKGNAIYHCFYNMLPCLLPIVDGFRRGVLDGDVVGGSIEASAGVLLEIGIFRRGMIRQNRIDTLIGDLKFRMEKAYIQWLIKEHTTS